MAEAHFTWEPDEISAEQFITTAITKVVHWKRNIFFVQSGKVGKAFVRELALLFRSHADGMYCSNSSNGFAFTKAYPEV